MPVSSLRNVDFATLVDDLGRPRVALIFLWLLRLLPMDKTIILATSVTKEEEEEEKQRRRWLEETEVDRKYRSLIDNRGRQPIDADADTSSTSTSTMIGRRTDDDDRPSD